MAKDTLNVLWIVDFDTRYQMRHGATLRCVNLSKGLTALGHMQAYAAVVSLLDRTPKGIEGRYLIAVLEL